MSDPQAHAAPPQAERDPRPEALAPLEPTERTEAPPPSAPSAAPEVPEVPGDEPRPLGIGVQPTGHAGVDARLARLADADRLPVAAHLEVYEDAHRALRDTLTALDQPRPGPAGPAPGPVPRS